MGFGSCWLEDLPEYSAYIYEYCLGRRKCEQSNFGQNDLVTLLGRVTRLRLAKIAKQVNNSKKITLQNKAKTFLLSGPKNSHLAKK